MLVLLVLAGCLPANPSSPPTGSGSDNSIDAGPLANGLLQALTERDQQRWHGWEDPANPVSRQSQLIFDNLQRLQVEGLTPTGRQRPVVGGASADRSVELTVAWSVEGWDHVRTTPLWLGISGTGEQARLVGVTDDDAGYRQPIWARQPIVVDSDGQTAVLAAANPQQWLQAAARVSVEADGLLIIVPQNGDIFTDQTGQEPVVAAITTAAADGLQVVIDPGGVGGLSALGRGVLISHEAVHVSTGAPNTDAPLWVEEGYAEFIAQQQWPQARKEMDEALGKRLSAGPETFGLPADDEFSGANAAVAYGRALLGWRAIGDDHAAEVYRAIIDGGSLDTALRPAKLTEDELADAVDRSASELARR